MIASTSCGRHLELRRETAHQAIRCAAAAPRDAPTRAAARWRSVKQGGTAATGQVTDRSILLAHRHGPAATRPKNRYAAQSSWRSSPRPWAYRKASSYCDSASPRRARRHRSAIASGLLRARTAGSSAVAAARAGAAASKNRPLSAQATRGAKALIGNPSLVARALQATPRRWGREPALFSSHATRTTSSRRSSPPVSIATIACSRTFGLAW